MEPENTFTISANTCTLKYNNQEGNAFVLDNKTKYIIPIYQRPYSWTDEQIRKFISDIFSSFWGNDGNSIEEPIFIGTMQLSAKNENGEQEIIDGQQRLTTFLILIKVLKTKFLDCEELQNIPLDWLSTRVNNGKQQLYLQELISNDLTFNDETLNPYLKNAFLINELLEEQTKDEEGQTLKFDIESFLKHLLSNVYFVVIQTRAGLSKTLQIFNAINTTGLDLNGGDIFKIRMYEYLRDKKGKDETAFDEINRLYQSIDDYNAQLKYISTNISGILGIYQYILIAKYNLPVALYSYSTDKFYEQLFDTLFNINQWEHFKNNIKNIELYIEDLETIIKVRYEWEINGYQTCEDACAMNFIWQSRYSRYWILTFVFLYKFKEEEDRTNKMFLFTKQLSKLYFIYSIRYLKSIYEVHTFTYALITKIIETSFEDVMLFLNDKIGKVENHKGHGDIENAIAGDITYNAKNKNLVCRLSAMLEEEYTTADKTQINKIKKALFETSIDVEHIQSYHHKNGDKREDIWNEWQENINSIGNLMLLEQKINRSISNNPYETKVARYPESVYTIVKNQPIHYPNWDLEKCVERKHYETQKILNYLFN